MQFFVLIEIIFSYAAAFGVKVYKPTRECSMAGGICILESDCAQDQLTQKRGLCSEPNVECCYEGKLNNNNFILCADHFEFYKNMMKNISDSKQLPRNKHLVENLVVSVRQPMNVQNIYINRLLMIVEAKSVVFWLINISRYSKFLFFLSNFSNLINELVIFLISYYYIIVL